MFQYRLQAISQHTFERIIVVRFAVIDLTLRKRLRNGREWQQQEWQSIIAFFSVYTHCTSVNIVKEEIDESLKNIKVQKLHFWTNAFINYKQDDTKKKLRERISLLILFLVFLHWPTHKTDISNEFQENGYLSNSNGFI